MTSHQDVIKHLGNTINTFLPFEWGELGVYEHSTSSLKTLIAFGDMDAELSNAKWIDDRSGLYVDLMTNWRGSSQLLVKEQLNRIPSRSFAVARFRGKTDNLLFDAIIKNETDFTCFYCLANIDESLREKYQLFMKLLCTYLFDTLVMCSLANAEVRQDINELTDRELDIICCIRTGLNNKNIAKQLNISVNTVKSHIYNIFQKLQARNRVEAMLKAEQAGYLIGARIP